MAMEGPTGLSEIATESEPLLGKEEPVATREEQQEAGGKGTGEVEEEEEEQEEEGEPQEVVVLTCILNQQGDLHGGRRIWRRLAVPSDFNLLELHVRGCSCSSL
eukprot:jgi/Mesen1/196/ME1137617C07562